jgi:hypothetical protein
VDGDEDADVERIEHDEEVDESDTISGPENSESEPESVSENESGSVFLYTRPVEIPDSASNLSIFTTSQLGQ